MKYGCGAGANNSTGSQTTSVGRYAGETSSASGTCSFGYSAGKVGQNAYATAFGYSAGNAYQGAYSISMGAISNSVAINSIAMGPNTATALAAVNSIAIGNSAIANLANMIVLNAGGSAFLPPTTTGFFVNPVNPRGLLATFNLLHYTATNEIAITVVNQAPSLVGQRVLLYNISGNTIEYSAFGAKTFVIDHPTDKEKLLVHACLEGPEAGVYYRGEGKISEGEEFTTIALPDYADKIAINFTVNLTRIFNPKRRNPTQLETTRVKKGQFSVYGSSGKFFWTVYGERLKIEVEPLRSKSNVRGMGPYTYIQ